MKERSKSKTKKGKKPRVLRQTKDLLPFKKTEDGLIKTKSGYVDVLQIVTSDLYSKNEDELNRLLYMRTGFLRSFNDSFKEIILNFPVDASRQRQYWLKKMRSVSDDPIKRKFIERKLFEFDFLEEEKTNREFFLFLFAKTKDQLIALTNQAVRSNQSSFPLRKLSDRKKRSVLFLLNNQNTKLPNNL